MACRSLGVQLALASASIGAAQTQLATGPVYRVMEIRFTGPAHGRTDSPARDVELWVRFRHESGSPEYRVHGFWDGGSDYRVRFTPTSLGRWTLAEVHSNRAELRGEKEGDFVAATPSELRGFWEVDEQSPGRRWYRRSDGSHQYIVGNTHYSFLSGSFFDGVRSGNDIAEDMRNNAEYLKKVRFSPIGDRYPHRRDKPFLDEEGRPTTSGDYSHRPNPEWFRERTDLAVQTAFEVDLVADLIMSGVDTEEARAALLARGNGGDPEPFLRYLAARYGSYPNVWLTLINEFDKRPLWYTPAQIVGFGRTLQKYLPYSTPVSVHRHSGRWETALNTDPAWNDHVIIQEKLRDLSGAADTIIMGYVDGGSNKPVINDELSYEGAGDDHSEFDTVESHLGAFLGGGYGTTGEKPQNKHGQYFLGGFDARYHSAVDNLRMLREAIDEHVTFWRMEPVPIERSIFRNVSPEFRAMQWPGREYVLGTDFQYEGITAHLPPGAWRVRRFILTSEDEERVLEESARGGFTFDAPDSRAVLFHFDRVGD